MKEGMQMLTAVPVRRGEAVRVVAGKVEVPRWGYLEDVTGVERGGERAAGRAAGK